MQQHITGFVVGLLNGGGSILAVALGLLALRAVVVSPLPSDIDRDYLLYSSPVLMLVVVAIEELVFRSFLVGWVSGKTTVTVGVLLSITVDYLLHIPNGGQTALTFVNSVLFSLSACLFYLRFGYGGALGFHYGWNLVQWTLLGFPMYGLTGGRWFTLEPIAAGWLTGADHGPENSLLTALVLAACLALWTRKWW